MKFLVSAGAVMLCAISSLGTATAQIAVSVNSFTCGDYLIASSGLGSKSSFPVLSWTVSGATTDKLGTSGTSVIPGAASLQNLTFIKTVDGCSADLIRLFVSGTVVPTVTLVQTAPSTRPFNLVTVTMTDVLVSNYAISGSASPTPAESVQLLYGKVCFATVSLNADGAPAVPQTVCYSPVTGVTSSN